jgi:hypothetical protein
VPCDRRRSLSGRSAAVVMLCTHLCSHRAIVAVLIEFKKLINKFLKTVHNISMPLAQGRALVALLRLLERARGRAHAARRRVIAARAAAALDVDCARRRQ